mmetsp:Transcript_28877/g.88325  ORF Transcript_28877/g.88325 Transcript_28877/m.88325 type:complete len:93 (+) Transcript_28877:81-359(+)
MLLTPSMIARLNAEDRVFGEEEASSSRPPAEEPPADKRSKRQKKPKAKQRAEEKPPEHFALSAFQLSPEPENLPLPSLGRLPPTRSSPGGPP